MNESLTSQVAQSRTLELLGQSIDALPPGTRLARVHPEYPKAELGPGKFSPCSDDNTVDDGPQRFDASFWASPRVGKDGLDKLVRSWRELGWSVEDGTETGGTSARGTSEGYILMAKLSNEGDLSVTGSSPCFAVEKGSDLDTVTGPDVVEQK